MNARMLVAGLLAAPLIAVAQGSKDAPRKATASKQEAVATVNGVPVPKARMDFMMQQQQARGAPDNDQTRAALRDNLINREVVAQEAQRSGVARNANVQTQLDIARQQIMIDAFIREWVGKNPVTDAEVQKEYDRARKQQGDKEYKARHILVETEDQAKKLIAELRGGGKFEDLAAANTKDTGTKERGGDLDWNVPAVFDKAFADAMVKLDKGKYTDAPVRSRFGYHVIRLDDVRQIQFPALDEVKPKIQQQLVQNKINELVKGLRAKAKVE